MRNVMLVIAILLAAGAARAGEVVLSVEGGVAIMGDSGLGDVGPLERDELATTLTGGLSVGYQTALGGGTIRGLVGLDYANIDGDWGVTTGRKTTRQTLDVQSSSFVLGAEYDIKQVEIGALYPFVGAGVRLVRNRPASGTLIEYGRHESGCLADDSDTWGFGYHALAGLGADFDPVTVRAFYQYTDRGSVDVDGDGCPAKLNPYTADVRGHEVRLRVSYVF